MIILKVIRVIAIVALLIVVVLIQAKVVYETNAEKRNEIYDDIDNLEPPVREAEARQGLQRHQTYGDCGRR